MKLREIIKKIPNEIKIAIRNASIIFIYSLSTNYIVLGILDFKTIASSLAIAGLVFSTELINAYQIKLENYAIPKPKSKPNLKGSFFFNGLTIKRWLKS